MRVAFALQKLLPFFQQKISAYLCISFVVSFEQLGPDVLNLESTQTSFLFPERSDGSAKRTENHLIELITKLHRVRPTQGPPP